MNNSEKINLGDNSLAKVTGGKGKPQYMKIACSCGTINEVDVSQDKFTCKKCKKTHQLCG